MLRLKRHLLSCLALVLLCAGPVASVPALAQDDARPEIEIDTSVLRDLAQQHGQTNASHLQPVVLKSPSSLQPVSTDTSDAGIRNARRSSSFPSLPESAAIQAILPCPPRQRFQKCQYPWPAAKPAVKAASSTAVPISQDIADAITQQAPVSVPVAIKPSGSPAHAQALTHKKASRKTGRQNP